MKESKYYVVYDNIGLSYKDVENFEEGCYLNDLNISFYYNYLTDKNKSYEAQYCLLDPAMSQSLYYDEDIDFLKACLDPLDLVNKKFIFIPINDNTDKYKQGGGSHWALIVYQKEKNLFFYLDSMSSFIKTTFDICKKMAKILDLKTFTNNNIVKVSINNLQQNYCDCGVFLLGFTECILDRLNKQKFSFVFDVKELMESINELDQGKVKILRNELKQLVEDIRSKKK